VRAIPLPSGRWRAWRRIDTGHAGRLHSRERAWGHVQPRCRGGGNVGRGKGCRRRHRSCGGSPASRDADGRGLHSATQRTSNRAARWQADGPPQQKPARRHDHPRVIAGAFNPRSRCARSPRPTHSTPSNRLCRGITMVDQNQRIHDNLEILYVFLTRLRQICGQIRRTRLRKPSLSDSLIIWKNHSQKTCSTQVQAAQAHRSSPPHAHKL